MSNAERGVVERDIAIERGLPRVITTIVVRDLAGFAVHVVVVDVVVIVRDPERRELIALDQRVVRGMVSVIVMVIDVVVIVAVADHDRAIRRVRVIVAVRREVQIREDLDAEQPQQRCGRREDAATAVMSASPPHRRSVRRYPAFGSLLVK